MNQERCGELFKQNIKEIAVAFQQKKEQQIKNIISCFYLCFQIDFIKWASIMHKNYTNEMVDFIAKNAFTDSIIKFQEKANSGKLYQGNASIKTILFSFYRYTLLEYFQKEKRGAQKHEDFLRLSKMENEHIDLEPASKEMQFKKLEEALARLEPIDKKIIMWRHLDLKTIDEIAFNLGITKEAASNRIYRCMERLRNLISKSN